MPHESGIPTQIDEILTLLAKKFPYVTKSVLENPTTAYIVQLEIGHPVPGSEKDGFGLYPRNKVDCKVQQAVYTRGQVGVGTNPAICLNIRPIRDTEVDWTVFNSSTLSIYFGVGTLPANEKARDNLLANLPALIDQIRRDNDRNQNPGLQALIEELRF